MTLLLQREPNHILPIGVYRYNAESEHLERLDGWEPADIDRFRLYAAYSVDPASYPVWTQRRVNNPRLMDVLDGLAQMLRPSEMCHMLMRLCRSMVWCCEHDYEIDSTQIDLFFSTFIDKYTFDTAQLVAFATYQEHKAVLDRLVE